MSYKYKNKLYGIAIKVVETGEIFETRTACADALDVSPGLISMYFSGKVRSCNGYHLEIIDTIIEHPLTEEILGTLYSLTGVECEWRDHPSRPNVYVSDVGMIAKNVRGRIMVLSQHLINSGYLVVSASDTGTKISENNNVLVHRLVAETFVPNCRPEINNCVNHIDGDKTNNCAWNLEWCTRSENMIHAVKHGLCKTDRVRIVETGETFSSAVNCAKAIGGTVSGIHDCKTGRQKMHRGYHFEFLGVDDE